MVRYVSIQSENLNRARQLKGLEDVISVTAVDYQYDATEGWHFSSADVTPGCDVDPNEGAKFMRDLYLIAEPQYSGRCNFLLFPNYISSHCTCPLGQSQTHCCQQ